MIRFFCDLTNGQFATSYRDRNEPRHYFPQDNDLPFRLYLLQSLPSTRWPFAYDDWSGKQDVAAIVSLRDTSAGISTLASSLPLGRIANGFEGLLHTNTIEVDNFLSTPAPAAEKAAAFCVDLVDGSGNKLNPFQRPVILRATPGTTTPTALGTILYLPEITSYVGAGTTSLESIIPRLGAIYEVVITGILASWRAETGSGVTDLPNGIIRPLNFDAAHPINLVRVGGI